MNLQIIWTTVRGADDMSVEDAFQSAPAPRAGGCARGRVRERETVRARRGCGGTCGGAHSASQTQAGPSFSESFEGVVVSTLAVGAAVALVALLG